MITERFTADILANIKDFQRKMKEVDKTIRKAAMGVTIKVDMDASDFNRDAASVNALISQLSNDVEVNFNGDISDLQRALAEAQAAIAAVNNDATVNINGNNSNFNNAANDVQRQTSKLSRKVTEARIGADIGSFETRMVEVMRALTEAGDTVTPQIELEMNSFMRDMTAVQGRMREIARSTANPQVEADIAGFMAQMALVEAQLSDVVETHDVDIRLDSGGFMAEIARIRLVLRSLTAKDFVVKIRAAWANYQAVMGAMASFSRNFGEIVGMTSRGIMISMSPAIVPVLASIIGLLGQLGPMIGVIAGSTFALATSFATAGVGAVAFGALAATNLKDVFKESKAAKSAMDTLKNTWSDIANSMKPQTVNIFTQSLGIMNGILANLTPMFTSVTGAVGRLIDSLGQSVKTESMSAFFDYLNKSAGPMMEMVFKSIGNLLKGFFSMMVAFGPLAANTAAGFQKMSEGFATWAAGLGESKKFQSFVNYVNENMPKIRSIFSDAFQGIINTFAAFAPSSADMMTGLQDMMERFKSWSAALGENQGFKKFIDYIQTNGPVVISTIGEIVDFIVNMGKAAAPIGEQMLGMINAMLDFGNRMLEAHPWLGKIAVGMVVVGGAFLAAMPILVGLNALTGGFITTVIRLGATFLVTAAKMAAGWITAMGPIGWIVVAIAALAILIYKYWDEISAWTKKAWTAVSTAVTAAVDKIMSWIQEKFPAIYDLIQSAMTMAKDVLITIWDFIKGTFSNALDWLKALVKGDFEGMSNAVKSQMTLMKDSISKIWDAVKTHTGNVIQIIKDKAVEKFVEMAGQVVGKILQLKNQALAKWAEIKTKTLILIAEMKKSISDKWEEIKSAAATKLAQLVVSVSTFFKNLVTKVKTKMTEAVTTVGQKVGEMPGKVLSFVGAMLSAGSDLVSGLISGIKNMAGAAIDAISGVVGGVIGKAKSLLKIKSPSRVFKEIGGFAGKGMAIGITKTEAENKKAITGVAKVLTSIAKTHANEINSISKEAAKKQAGIQSEAAKKAKSIQTDSAVAIQRIISNASAKKRNLTVAESNKIYDLRKSAATKITNLESSSAKQLASINSKASADKLKKENELAKLRLDGIKQFVDDKKSLDDISLVAEGNVWRRLLSLFKEGSKERIAAQKNYRDTLQTINNEMIKASEDFANKQSDINSKLIADEQALTKAYTDAVSSRADAIKGFAGLFDEITKPDEAVSGKQLLDNLIGQVQSMQKWQSQIRSLEMKGIDKNLLEELRQMGPKAVNELEALNSMTGVELTKYSNLFKQKSAIARKEAEYELQGMKADTAKQIDQLRKVANTELSKLKTDFSNTIKAITQGTNTQFKTLTQIGKDAIKGLQNGMIGMSPALLATAKQLANSVSAEIAKALKIKSPSRVMMELGGYVVEGLNAGILDNTSAVVTSITRMSAAMTNAFDPQLAMAGVDVSMNSLDTQSQMDVLSRQIKNELSVDMSVNHTGSASTGAVTQETSGDVVLVIDGHELARVQRGHLDGMNGKRVNLASAMKGRRYK